MNPNEQAGGLPRVSVVMASYNAEDCIRETLKSALNQKFTDLEVVVVDDGSTDQTVEILKQIAALDPRCRWISQENRGPGAARNHGLRLARGELIAFLDHDDFWHPDKISLQVALFDLKPELAVVTCYSTVIDQNGQSLGWRLGGEARGSVYEEMIEWDMVSGGSVAMVRRQALEKVAGYDESLLYREDWDLWIRLSRIFRFGTVTQSLVGFTRHSRNSSREYSEMAREGEWVLRQALANDPSIGEKRIRYCLARDLFAIACHCGIDLDQRLAWHYLRRSCSITPLPLLKSPRRWAFIGVLLLQTLLPRRMYLAILHALSRLVFGLRPGQPFQAEMGPH